MDRMLALAEAARVLGVPRGTVARWVLRGIVQGQRVGHFWAIPEAEVERLKAEGRPVRRGLPKGTRLSRRYEGVCIACGQPFTASRPARFCSPRCSARYRARERKAARKAAR